MTTKRYCFYCGTQLEVVKKETGAGKQTRFFCPKCHAKFYNNPVPAVAALVLRGEKLLLVRRAVPPSAGNWCLPGGFVESGENTLEALSRELFEETGLRGKATSLVDVVSFVDPDPERKGVIIIGYMVGTFEGQLRPGDDAEEVRFFSLNDLPSIPFSSHRALIGKIQQMTEMGRSPFNSGQDSNHDKVS